MKTCIIMGCGPSLAALQVKRLPQHVHTFGMKNAWKYFQRMGWWPTYYANLDKVNEEYNRDALAKIIQDPCVLTQKFFLHEQICMSDRLKVVRYRRGLFDFGNSLEDMGDGGSTGCNAAQIAVILGYRQIILVGIDLSYGSDKPDFFITDYRNEGEPYNEPNIDEYHNKGWRQFAEWAKKKSVMVVNCGKHSRLEYFRRENLAQALKKAT